MELVEGLANIWTERQKFGDFNSVRHPQDLIANSDGNGRIGISVSIPTPLARHTVLIRSVLLTLAVLYKSLTCKTKLYD